MKKLVCFLLLLSANYAIAENCSIPIGANDDMLFDIRKITISRKCEDFSITLKHNGKAKKDDMGHNLVIAKLSDLEKISLEGQSQGLENGYLNANDARIIAHTKMLGGGEQDTVTFKVSSFANDVKYGYICTYPGHFIMMRGAIVLED